jgi:hypothetical protein
MYHINKNKSLVLSRNLLQMNAANQLLHPFYSYPNHSLSVIIGASTLKKKKEVVTTKIYTHAHVYIKIRYVVVSSFKIFWKLCLLNLNLSALQGTTFYMREIFLDIKDKDNNDVTYLLHDGFGVLQIWLQLAP